MAQCAQCNASVLRIALVQGVCGKCFNDNAAAKIANDKVREDLANREKLLDQRERSMSLSKIILTTETAHNLPVTDRLGIVTAEVVIGMHVFKDIASVFRDVFGGRSQTMQKGLKEARTAALDELRAEAHALGADAVVGVDLDYSEISGGGKSMLFLVASGTAVRLGQIGNREILE